MATSMPSPQEQPSFLAAVRGFCHLLYTLDKPNEMKAATFIFEHTICYQEFDSSKRITLDEFVNGRKRRDGKRFSTGCGIPRRDHVSLALHSLESRQAITVMVDEHDQARKRKFYRLTLPSLDQCTENRDTQSLDVPKIGTPATADVSESDTTLLPAVPKTGTPSTENRDAVYLKLVPDQSKYLKQVPKASTFSALEAQDTIELDVAPLARTSSDVQERDVLTLRSEDVEDAQSPLEPAEERARLQNYLERLKAIDPRRLSRVDQITQRNRIRRIERRLEELDQLSDSPAQEHAPTPPAPEEQASIIPEPGRAALYESATAIETPTPAPDALFPEAAPTERPNAVIARLFFREGVKMTDGDWREVQSVVNVLHEHGVDDPWRIEELYMYWRDRYRDLKRKTMYHFKQHAFQTAQ